MSNVTWCTGNIFDAGVVIAIAVNCEGKAGKGQALECRQRFPWWFDEYKEACKAGAIAIGKPYLHKKQNGFQFLDFPTKDLPYSPSEMGYIRSGFIALPPLLEGVEAIAFPKLGCGYGGLKWDVVGMFLVKAAEELPCKVYIYV